MYDTFVIKKIEQNYHPQLNKSIAIPDIKSNVSGIKNWFNDLKFWSTACCACEILNNLTLEF